MRADRSHRYMVSMVISIADDYSNKWIPIKIAFSTEHEISTAHNKY